MEIFNASMARSLRASRLCASVGEGRLVPYFTVIRERAAAWDWTLPMRRQVQWEAHAAFMDALADEGFIVAGGPLGNEDDARRVMHVIVAPDVDAIEARMAADPWTPTNMLRTVSIEPWTILLGGFNRS
jgi:uncharacterized protein YciI